MNNYELYKYINFIASEDAYGNTFSPAEFDNLLKVKSLDYYQSLLKQYEIDRIETHSIKRFKAKTTKVVFGGVFDLPGDYQYMSSILSKYYIGLGSFFKYRRVDMVTDEEWDMRRASSVKMPTTKDPIARILNTTVEILPDNIDHVELNYLRKPAIPVFILTLDANDNPTVYTSASIVELDFEDYDKIAIAHQILSLRGVNLKEPTLVEFANFMEQKDKQ